MGAQRWVVRFGALDVLPMSIVVMASGRTEAEELALEQLRLWQEKARGGALVRVKDIVITEQVY